MGSEQQNTAERPAVDPGRYARSAFDFIREGLGFAVERVHGPLTPPQAVIAQYMAHEDIDLREVGERRDAGKLEPEICEAIDNAGGFGQLNRHVGGQELCWALRDCAVSRWGALASVVLRTWGITETADFGNLVFALIDAGLLQKQPHDRLLDFRDVFDFQEAFDNAFQFELQD